MEKKILLAAVFLVFLIPRIYAGIIPVPTDPCDCGCCPCLEPTPEPTPEHPDPPEYCDAGYIGSAYCSGGNVVRDYQTARCFITTNIITTCSCGCSNGACLSCQTCGNGIVEGTEQCDPPNTFLSTCAFGTTYLEDYCTSTCMKSDSTCESSFTGCTSSPSCDEQTPGTGYCSLSCGYSECLVNDDCNRLDKDYCSSNRIMHDEGICVDSICQAQATQKDDCGLKNGIIGDCGAMQWSCSEEINQTTCVLNNIVPVETECPDYCQGTTAFQGTCDSARFKCIYAQAECNNGLYCDGQETCSGGACFAGTTLGCSGNNITGIATCNNTPDAITYTWDYRLAFTSTCNETTDSCTTGDTSITHACSKILCSAQCETNSDCTCQQDTCVGFDYYDYADSGECTSNCMCTSCTLTIYKNDSRCGECTENADCDDGLYCNGQETCNLTNYTCQAGTQPNCSDSITCTSDSCNETTDQCDHTPNNSLCNDGQYCNGTETCNPAFGCWAGTPINCTDFNISSISTCDWNPDAIHYTWDYRVSFTSTCNENTDTCNTGNTTITHNCSIQNCGAQCETNSDCACQPDGCMGKDYYDYPTNTTCSADCTCGTCTASITYNDPRCNPPTTSKSVGEPKIACNYFGDLNEANECWLISTQTQITMSSHSDYCTDINTYYRLRWKLDYDSTWGAWGNWIQYAEPFSIAEDSIHELEYYSNGCGVSEQHKYEIDIVDNQAPEPIKTVGNPSTTCKGDLNCDYKITMDTPITLECKDRQPHPVEGETLCYRYFLDGSLVQDWTCGDSPVEIIFDEECFHQLDFYCKDSFNNTSEIDSEIFKVEGHSFKIPLYKKWNLISIPYVPLDDNIELVLADVLDNTEAVWSYFEGEWHVFKPGKASLSNLSEMRPGYGYWILMKDSDELVIGGSLFNPTEVPPSRNLESGWNLIGYYGTIGDNYSQMEDWTAVCGGTNPQNSFIGDKAYCSLGTMIKGPGNPITSSLVSYINCGNAKADWSEIDLCIEDPQDFTRMYAGRGYWAFLNEAAEYAPSTVCIWSEELICP